MKPPATSKKETPLVVHGTGYREPRNTNIKRAGTATTMRRSGSIGNLPRATIPPQQIRKTHDDCICTSSHEAATLSKELIREQYTRSLEQQVQLLELENSFLKQGNDSNPGKVVNIMSRGNELSVNGKDWCRLPSFHPPLEKVLGDRISQAVNTGSSFKLNKEQSFDTTISHPHRDSVHTRLFTSDSRRISHSPEGKVSFRGVKALSPDAQLLNELEDKAREVELLKEQITDSQEIIRKREERINQLSVRLREAESDISSRSEADTRDKRALMEEALELQRRLDDLTPVLAEKEARITKVEDEKEALVMKIRILTLEIGDLKLKLTEKTREQDLHKEREKSSLLENTRLREQIERLQYDLEESKKKEEDLLDDIGDLKRKMKEIQLHNQNDRQHIDQLSSENSKLISENSRLTTELAKVEYNIEKIRQENSRENKNRYTEEEVIELRLTVKAHLTQISILEERLKAAQARNEILEKELESRSTTDVDARNERSRIQKELEALQALSRSLSTENKSLREEKMSLTEKVESLKGKVTSREIQIKNLEDDISERERMHEENLHKLEKDSLAQGQRALELEELSRRVRELSDSFTTDNKRIKTRTINSSIMQKTIQEEPEKDVYKCLFSSSSKIHELSGTEHSSRP